MKKLMPFLTFLQAPLISAYLLVCGAGAAFADAPLPDVDAKFVSVKEINPTRDAGYVVGDTLDRTVILKVKKPYELVKESLPIVGYEHRWKGQTSGIELVNIEAAEQAQNDSTVHTIKLRYQVFTTGRVAKPASLRGEVLKVRNTAVKGEVLQYRIPSFSFRVSPLSVIGQVKLREEMSPFVPPFLLNSEKERLHITVLATTLGLSLLGLLYIFGAHAWLPKMNAPFAKAYRDIRKLPDTPEGLQQAVARVHQSFNITAGNSFFADNMNEFLAKKAAFAPMKTEIEKFFGLSRQVFFEASPSLENNTKQWLLKFCRQLRDCERGLRPEVAQSDSGAAQ